MFYPTTYPIPSVWLPNLHHWLRQWLLALKPAPAQQVQLQVGDSYHLAAGSYRLRVLAGSVWLPEVGIFRAGEQIAVTVEAAGLAIHSYAQQAVVFTLRTA